LISTLQTLQGFTDGVMKVGPHAGKKVSEAKPIIKEAMLADGSGLAYSEPEKMVSCDALVCCC
jgi:leucyl-tRNA synthetase